MEGHIGTAHAFRQINKLPWNLYNVLTGIVGNPIIWHLKMMVC